MEKTALGDIESVDRNTGDFQDLGDVAASKSDQRLRELGYKSEFRREFSVSFHLASTQSKPLTSPAHSVRCCVIAVN